MLLALCASALVLLSAAATASNDPQQMQVAFTPIYEIQGMDAASPLVDSRVNSYGLVTGITPDGFYLQDPVGDGDGRSSDGIYVYTYRPPMSMYPEVRLGACLAVHDALVQEYYGKTELNWVGDIKPSSKCDRPAVIPAALDYLGLGDKDQLYERWEGMAVEVDALDGIVHGPTKHYASGEAEIAFLPLELQIAVSNGRIFHELPRDSADLDVPWPGEGLRFVSSLLGGDLPDANWGDRIRTPDDEPLHAILDYNFGKYQLLLLPDQSVTVEHMPIAEETASKATSEDYTVCTFNVHGLGRGAEQHTTQRTYDEALGRAAAVIAKPLQGCTIVALQETGTPQDADALASVLSEEYALDYAPVVIPGPLTNDPDYPLTNSLLVRADRVRTTGAFAAQGCSDRDYGVIDTYGEPCPLGQYPLFNRPPLVVDLHVQGEWDHPVELRLINNHWKSKAGDEEINARRRIMQAAHVAKLVDESRSSGTTQIIVLGDLNDFTENAPLRYLTANESVLIDPLVDVWNYLPVVDAYSYIFNGVSQVLDHILISPDMVQSVANVDVLHVNADFAMCSSESNVATCQAMSDHDPLLIRLRPDGAASVGGELGFAGVLVELSSPAAGQIFSTRTVRDGSFRLWDVPAGTATMRYAMPNWLRIDDGAAADETREKTVEMELRNGFNEVDSPTILFVPAVRAADATSALIDAAFSTP
jgi:hypothetical protein